MKKIDRVTLVQAPWLTVTNAPNIGLAYIAAVLRRADYTVSVIDLNVETSLLLDADDKKIVGYTSWDYIKKFTENTFLKYKPVYDKAVRRILDTEPEAVGFSVWESNDILSRYFAEELKRHRPGLKIIFGGPACYPLYQGHELILHDYIDYVIYGEAEISVLKVLEAMSSGRETTDIPGTIKRKNGISVDCGQGERPERLDELPFSALDLLPLSLYQSKSLPISFNRGCIYKCEYCELAGMKPGFRARSARNIFNELLQRKQEFPDKNDFFVCDCAITAHPSQISELCDLIIASGIRTEFSGYATFHPLLSDELIVKMEKAGFMAVVLGVESGSDKILGMMGKKFNREAIERTIHSFHAARIMVGVNILVGLPGETENDFEQSIDFLAKNRKFIKNIGACYFGQMPYSAIYYHPEKYEFVPEDVKRRRYNRLKEFISQSQLYYTAEDKPAK